jgi:hypothetical protein
MPPAGVSIVVMTAMHRHRPTLMRSLALLATLCGAACSDPASSSGELWIRIGNESRAPFTKVEVIFPEDHIDYGQIIAGGASAYHRVAVAYAYARIDVQVGGTSLRIQPIDYVGESVLNPGRYTYALNVVNGALTLELKHD